MALIARKKVVLAKKEVTYGTDPVPTGAANAILASNINITPLDAIERDRDTNRQYLGNDQSIIAGKMVRCSFEVEMAGSGAAGTAPGWGPLMLGCGMSETINAGVDVQYKPISTAFDSVTIYFNQDGVRHALVGARGNLRVAARNMEIPKFLYEFTGLYVAVADAVLPTAVLTAFQQPLAVNNANSSAFNIHGYAGKLSNLELDLANSVIYRNVVGEESVQITDRKPAGTLVMDAPTVAQKDVWASVLSSTLSTLSLLHGTTPGNKVQIDAPKVQMLRPGYAEQDSLVTMNMGLRLMPNSGNDELVVIAK